ncbi:MAG: trigger factor [Bacteroidetes bacterium]|nr:trigger factor [Bacteroidota bacterium]
MKVTKESTGELTSVLRIDISKEDYAQKVEGQLKDYRRKANVPGFRVGQVPMGMVKQMYEKSVRADEIQKLMTNAMYDYIEAEKLNIIGHPMANEEKTPDIDWDNQTEYTFYFDIAMQPEFDIELDKMEETFYNIEPNKEMLDKFIEDLQRRFGKFESPETITEEDLVYGEVAELDEEGNVKEGGVKTITSLAINMIAQKTIQKKFIGQAKDSEIVFNLAKAFTNSSDVAAMLRISKEEAEAFKSDVKFTVSSINRITPAELNEEFFEKAYKGQDITTLEQFQARAKQDLGETYKREADRYFMNEVTTKLVAQTKINLPDEFMKRWLIANNEGKVDADKVAAEYEMYKDSLKWQMIENKLVEKYSLTVSNEEVKSYYKEALLGNYFPASDDETPEQTKERLDAMEKVAENMLNNKEQGKQVFEYLFDQKLTKALRENMKITEKSISIDDFTKMIQEKTK